MLFVQEVENELPSESIQTMQKLAVKNCQKAYMKAAYVSFNSWADVIKEAKNIMGPLVGGRLKHLKNVIRDGG